MATACDGKKNSVTGTDCKKKKNACKKETPAVPYSRGQHPAPLNRREVCSLVPAQVHEVLGRSLLVDGFDFVFDLDKSHGPFLHDSRTGKDFLDMFSFFASWPVSHNHPKLRDANFRRTMARIATHNPANSDIYTIEMGQFVATFERVAMPAAFKHLFFVSGGALAVENALKAAFDWKVRKNLAKGKGELGQRVIHFREAFHGRSGYTLSMTNTTDPRKWQYFPRFTSWPRISCPKAHFPLQGENLSRTQAAEAQALREIEDVLHKDADDVAAILLEPVQGEGGDNHFRPEFWQQLRRLADQHDVMLIADEVQSGMGLTGKFWSYQHLGADPDIICFGKKSQVCGIMATERIDQVKENVFALPSRINSTWGGNLVDMVRSRKLLEIIEEEKLVENAASVGAHLLAGLERLAAKYPQQLSNVRGKGLMAAFDCATPEACSRVRSLACDKGLLLLSCGTQTIRFRPMLDVTNRHIDIALRVLDEAMATAFAVKAAL